MNSETLTSPVAIPARGRTMPALLGLARLMPRAFRGESLTPLADEMMQRIQADEHDADAWMDLSTILMLQGIADTGLVVQAQALKIRRSYELLPERRPVLRLLALMAPGDLMTNAPLAFLVERSDIALTMLYIAPGEPIPARLPAHDVLYVAISQQAGTDALLLQLEAQAAAWTTPLRNRPARIAQTCRSRAFHALAGGPGLRIVATTRATRAALRALADGGLAPEDVLPDGEFPLIVRPVDSHAGHGLERVDDAAAIAAYLDAHRQEQFFLSPFVDYRSADGLYRKYRVVLVDGQPYPAHMGVSAHWMIHYLNAGMAESAAKRADEERFMRGFDADFAPRHAAALRAIHERMGLDYLVIDCAETERGELLVFELDPGAVVHSMDPVDCFPYKQAHMDRIYAAFRAMLLGAAASAAA